MLIVQKGTIRLDFANVCEINHSTQYFYQFGHGDLANCLIFKGNRFFQRIRQLIHFLKGHAMQANQIQEVAVEVIKQVEPALITELRDLQLAFVGGGMGQVAFG